MLVIVVVVAVVRAAEAIVIVQAKTALQNGLSQEILAGFRRESRELSARNDLSRLVSLFLHMSLLVSGGPYWSQGGPLVV